jgi:hypothetical protein
MAQLISAQAITRSEACIAYRSIFLPSLRYSLSSTNPTLTRQELATVKRSSTQVLLSALEFDRNMPLKVVHGPAHPVGVGLRHLCIE